MGCSLPETSSYLALNHCKAQEAFKTWRTSVVCLHVCWCPCLPCAFVSSPSEAAHGSSSAWRKRSDEAIALAPRWKGVAQSPVLFLAGRSDGCGGLLPSDPQESAYVGGERETATGTRLQLVSVKTCSSVQMQRLTNSSLHVDYFLLLLHSISILNYSVLV